MRLEGDSALRARFDKIENFLNTPQDSRILEIKTGLSKETSANAERCPLFCERAQGRILGRM